MLLYSFLTHAREVEDHANKAPTALLDELDQSARSLFERFLTLSPDCWWTDYIPAEGSAADWWIPRKKWRNTFPSSAGFPTLCYRKILRESPTGRRSKDFRC